MPQLSCSDYLSFMPLTDNDEGSIVSNSLFEAALTRTSPVDNSTLSGLDYSWIPENYPVPPYPDLLNQVDAFITSPRSGHPPRETLWVFNIGFWDVWHLAALPRKLATHLIEAQTEHLFSRLELIYEEAHKNDSIAFSDYYSDINLATAHTTADKPLPRAPFRVLIPKPFDISLTPGFESARFAPPPPHTKAEQMRNAAFLTHYWDKAIQDMLGKWVRLPDPEETHNENELSEINDADLLLSKKNIKVNGLSIPPARREAITYDISGYIRELMVERQLRDADLVDHDGLGSTMISEGYSEVWEPCIKREDPLYDNNNGTGNDTENSIRWSLCNAPDEHLFWTEFTVNRRTIFEIGDRVAKLFRRHARLDAEWVEKSQHSLSSLRKGPDGAPLRVDIIEE
ncbi:hypothetical protein GGS26DRAFT_564527 [Hypomontagnella submonticulosa]|nr:hypothetical protein GGS26DRAFT_564527 [Hypomontagnella submonticulosa]